ncbi:MAG: helix-hairpin-helix domain-containing protein [Leifsonia sp.]
MDDAADEGLDRLHPSARAPSRTRVAVGGVIVLALAALIAAVVVGLVGAGGAGSTIPRTDLPADLRGDGTASATPAPSARLLVHVFGAVQRPGLYELAPAARVVDVVAAAGGFSDGADQGGVNLARLVADGEQIRVPLLGEVLVPSASGTGSTGAGGPVNLNTATVADLDTLPRIGPGLAQRIIDWRVANGGFGSVDDLRQVTGIGDKTFEALKPLVTV